jgi:cysteine synthase
VKTALELGPGHNVVTLICDSGARHVSKFWAQIGEIGGEAKVDLENILDGRVID